MQSYLAELNPITGTSLTLGGAITGATTINASGTITAPTFSGALSGNSSTASSTNYWVPATNYWFNDVNSRPRFHFVNNGTSSHTIIRSGSSSTYFRDSSDVDCCIIDKFGINAYFEVVSSTTDFYSCCRT